MAVSFALGNAVAATALANVPLTPGRLAIAALVTVLFFFRLRCFDEIKDYAVDRQLNPGRPLARGLLTLRAVRLMIGAVTAAEFALVAPLGVTALALHAVATGYSFLMYREFFIGAWLRPRLTTYALTHTAVSILLGYSIAAQILGAAAGSLPGPAPVLGLTNWAMFNVFEFGRKTFAPSEEVSGSDSYSLLYGPRGAVLLCLSQAAAALILTAGWFGADTAQLFAAGVLLAFALAYAVRPGPVAARAYRTATGAYVIVFYILLAMTES